MPVETGEEAPDFQLAASNGKTFELTAHRGQWVVIYFYPKDDTPGCTREACAFRDNAKRFAAQNAMVVGISADDLKSHDKFITKFNLPFLLLTDPDHEVAKQYGVWKEKNMYGKKVMGIERSTFLVDPDGRLHAEWRKVKVEHHADEILDELRAMNS